MMFDEFCINQILEGKKTVTRRLPTKNGRRPAVPGTIHKLKKDRTQNVYSEIFINSCKLTSIKEIDKKEAMKEGFDSRTEYIAYFMNINNIDMLNSNDLVWRVSFTLI